MRQRPGSLTGAAAILCESPRAAKMPGCHSRDCSPLHVGLSVVSPELRPIKRAYCVSNGKHGAAGIENGQDLVDDLLQALAKT